MDSWLFLRRRTRWETNRSIEGCRERVGATWRRDIDRLCRRRGMSEWFLVVGLLDGIGWDYVIQ